MDLRRKRKMRIWFIFCLLFISSPMLFHVPHSLAAIITYDYTGVAGISSTVTGSFGYDTDALDQSPAVLGSGRYLTGFIDGTVSGGIYDGLAFDYNLSGTGAGAIFVQTSYLPDIRSSFVLNEWIDFSSNSFFSRLTLVDEVPPLARTDDLLPLDLNLADYVTFAQLFVGSLDSTVAYNITSITKRSEPIPEPSTLLLLGVGLAGFGLLRRRFKN